MTTYQTITTQDRINALADGVVQRERELFSYDLNIGNYEAMLATMPQGDWPAELTQYKTATLDQVPDQHDATVSEYQFRDRVAYLIRTERAERSKAARVYEALLAQIPEADRAEAIAAAKARAEAA